MPAIIGHQKSSSIREILVVNLEQQDRKTVKNKKKLSDNYQGTRTASGYAVPKCKITQYRSSQKHVTGNLQSI